MADASIALSQSKLVAFNIAAGNTDTATTLTAAQVTGDNDAQTQAATKFFLQAFNSAAPPDGYDAAPIPITTPITDRRVIAALTYETDGRSDPANVYPVTGSGFPVVPVAIVALGFAGLWWANREGYL